MFGAQKGTIMWPAAATTGTTAEKWYRGIDEAAGRSIGRWVDGQVTQGRSRGETVAPRKVSKPR